MNLVFEDLYLIPIRVSFLIISQFSLQFHTMNCWKLVSQNVKITKNNFLPFMKRLKNFSSDFRFISQHFSRKNAIEWNDPKVIFIKFPFQDIKQLATQRFHMSLTDTKLENVWNVWWTTRCVCEGRGQRTNINHTVTPKCWTSMLQTNK